MNGAVFVDTSAWYALADADDRQYPVATGCLRRLLENKRRLLTTNHVASETYTLLRKRLGYGAAQQFLFRLRAVPAVRRIFVPEAWEEAAEDLLAHYRDQRFSYVDATSFVAMRRLGLQMAFTFDRDFVIAGFILAADQA